MTKITVKVMLMKLRKSFSLSISFSLKFKNVSQLAVTYSIPDVCKLLQILIATPCNTSWVERGYSRTLGDSVLIGSFQVASKN